MLRSCPMFWNPALRSRSTLTAVTLVLIVAFFCRGLWAAEQGTHAASPVINPAIQAIEHGHYHEPVLDHFHPEDAGISDASHILLHVMGAIENQMAVHCFAPPAHRARTLLVSHTSPIPSEPQLSGLFRPPRV